ncbi:MAG: hypothetical protein IIT70_02745 [Clostridia bacterium]|nr:hypothetical protein [Clostridia bacterium]
MSEKCRVGRKLHRLDLLMAYYLRNEAGRLIPPAQMRMKSLRIAGLRKISAKS